MNSKGAPPVRAAAVHTPMPAFHATVNPADASTCPDAPPAGMVTARPPPSSCWISTRVYAGRLTALPRRRRGNPADQASEAAAGKDTSPRPPAEGGSSAARGRGVGDVRRGMSMDAVNEGVGGLQSKASRSRRAEVAEGYEAGVEGDAVAAVTVRSLSSTWASPGDRYTWKGCGSVQTREPAFVVVGGRHARKRAFVAAAISTTHCEACART